MIKHKTHPKCIHGATGSLSTRVPSCKLFPSQALGSHTEAGEVAVVPQIHRAECVGDHLWQRNLYPGRLLLVPAAEPGLAQLARGREPAQRGRGQAGQSCSGNSAFGRDLWHHFLRDGRSGASGDLPVLQGS